MNSLYQQLNANKSLSLPSNIRQMINTVKGMSNPQVYAQQMLQQNPQLQTILKMSNGNAEQAFKTMCKQYNVDPNEILNMMK